METLDGRTARRHTNRARVVEAMLELIDEHGIDPTVDQLVDRSGISERSIFRYFDNLDDLRRAVIQRNFERVQPLLEVDRLGDGPLDERIARMVETRLRVCEAIAGVARVARRNAAAEPLVAEDVARFRRLLAHQVRAHFAPELSSLPKAHGADVEVLIDVLLSVDSWEQLSSGYGRSRAQVRRAWTRGLHAILAAT